MSQLRIPALAIAALLGLGMAVTAGAQRAQSAQEIVMRHCNAEASARHLMGSSRRTFMRTCLRSPPRQHLALTTQQRRMRYCNAQARAKGLTGDDHKRFMSSCLRMR
jgi:psiF repeat